MSLAAKLIAAAGRGDLPNVQAGTRATTNYDVKGIDGHTALTVAASRNDTLVIKALLQRGASAEAQAKNGDAPVLWAVANGHVEACEVLLQKTGDIKIRNTAIYRAAEQGHLPIVELCLREGISAKVADEDNVTTLMLAIEKAQTHVAEYLVDHGAVETAADANAQESKGGRTALSYAAEKGYHQLAERLIQKGAKANITDKGGRRPSDYARQGSSLKTMLQKVEVEHDQRDAAAARAAAEAQKRDAPRTRVKDSPAKAARETMRTFGEGAPDYVKADAVEDTPAITKVEKRSAPDSAAVEGSAAKPQPGGGKPPLAPTDASVKHLKQQVTRSTQTTKQTSPSTGKAGAPVPACIVSTAADATRNATKAAGPAAKTFVPKPHPVATTVPALRSSPDSSTSSTQPANAPAPTAPVTGDSSKATHPVLQGDGGHSGQLDSMFRPATGDALSIVGTPLAPDQKQPKASEPDKANKGLMSQSGARDHAAAKHGARKKQQKKDPRLKMKEKGKTGNQDTVDEGDGDPHVTPEHKYIRRMESSKAAGDASAARDAEASYLDGNVRPLGPGPKERFKEWCMKQAENRKANQTTGVDKGLKETDVTEEDVMRFGGCVPDAFSCPISFAIMVDPVIAEDNHTYERKSIEEWIHKVLSAGTAVRSPLTNEVMGKELRPNECLKNMIEHYVNIIKHRKLYYTGIKGN